MDDYYERAKEWGEDRYHSAHKWNGRLFVLLVIALVVIAILSAALAGLIPLKREVPFLTIQDSVTGEISVPRRIDPNQFDSQWQVDQAFIWKYFKARERFEGVEQEDQDYKMVQILSSKKSAQEYVSYYQQSTSAKPAQFKVNDKRLLKVRAFIKLDDGRVQIHWNAEDYINGKWEKPKHFISTIRYTYDAEAIPSAPEYKLENMVGFMATDYQREPTTITE